MFFQSGNHGLDISILDVVGAELHSCKKIEGQCDDKSRNGGVKHMPDMFEQIGFRHPRSQIGCIGKWGHFIAEIGSGYDGSRHERVECPC